MRCNLYKLNMTTIKYPEFKKETIDFTIGRLRGSIKNSNIKRSLELLQIISDWIDKKQLQETRAKYETS